MRLARRPFPHIKVLRRPERGQMLILAALVLTLVLGMGALSVDVGFYLHERQNVEGAVDAGALAGAALLPTDGSAAADAAMQFTLANDPNLTAAKVSISFRCLVTNVATDVPLICNPKTDASWTASGSHQVSPCIPANGDVCNVIIVTANATQKFFLAPVLGMKQKSTGSVTSAACSGTCGGPPTTPVDVALIIDRTSSMSAADLTNARTAADAILQSYNPSLQWVALGLLGPSTTTSTCSGSPAVHGNGATVAQYDTTTVAKWIPVGLSGIGAGVPVNESYVNSGVLNASSQLVKAIACFNTSGTGTNLSTPITMAKNYLLASGRSGVRKGIIFETDGSPNAPSPCNAPCVSSDFTCQTAYNEAQAAKAASIEIFTIGFGVGAGDTCPDSSGTYHNKSVTAVLADMATSSTDNGCVSAENSDGDHFFCAPRTTQLTSIFQAVAGSLAAGSILIPPP